MSSTSCLQVFEDGQLTDGLGNTVDFKNAILIMTSNIGARHLMKKQGLGFQSDREDMVSEKVEELVKQEVKKTFNPEFLNRLDEVILFQSLNDADLLQIVELLVQQLNANLAQKSITISVTEEAKKWILDKTLSRPQLRRAPLAPRPAALRRGPPVAKRSSPAKSPRARPSSRSTSTPTSSSIARSAPTRASATKRPPASCSSAPNGLNPYQMQEPPANQPGVSVSGTYRGISPRQAGV